MNTDSERNPGTILENLVPQPRRYQIEPGEFYIDQTQTGWISGPDQIRLAEIKTESSLFFKGGYEVVLALTIKPSPESYRLVLGQFIPPDPIPPGVVSTEAYSMVVSSAGVTVEAPTSEGLQYAIQTLYQLTQEMGDQLAIPAVRIVDWPHYRWRGFMVDQGRAPNSLERLKRIVRIGAAFKLNRMVFREGDDELNAIRYRNLPLGSSNPYALTMDDMADLVSCGRRVGVTIIPEVESLGHCGAKAFHYPDRVDGGITTDYFRLCRHRRKVHLRPSAPESLSLLRQIYQEWAPLLTAGEIHIGFDEVRLPPDVQRSHLENVLPLLETCLRGSGQKVTPIVWSDAPSSPAGWEERIVRCLWDYAEHNEIGPVSLDNPHLQQQGIVSLFADGCQQPVLLAGGSGSRHQPYSKCGYEVAFQNLADWARLGADRQNVLGLLAVQWGGNMLDLWLPDFAAAGDQAWTVPPPCAFNAYQKRILNAVMRVEAAFPEISGPADHPTWDGIRLRNRWPYEDIMTGQRAEWLDQRANIPIQEKG